MSTLFEKAKVSLIVADYAAVEASGSKINMLGAFSSVFVGKIMDEPKIFERSVLTPPFAIMISVAVPSEFVETEYAISLELRTETGEVVLMPGSKAGEKLRISQIVKVEEPVFPEGLRVPGDKVWHRHNMCIAFVAGIPLSANTLYRWVVEIDSNLKAEEGMYVVGPNPTEVIGNFDNSDS